MVDIITFDSFATLDKLYNASPDVKAHNTPVYRKGDMVKGGQANAGKHNSNCMINCDANGNGGAKGKLVTAQKSVTASATPATNPEAPAGQRSSEKLERLKDAKSKLEAGQLDLNALDEYVNFKDSNNQLDGLIGQIQGTPGSATDYAAQATRGVLGFVKDGAMGIGEMAYESIKAVPKLVRRQYTDTGQAISELDGQIFAENIKLGNITPGTLGQDALNIGKGIVKPVTDPWKKGQYVEAGTRAVTEIGTLAFGWIKGSKAAQAAKAAEALKAEEAAEAARVAAAAEAAKAKELEDAAAHVDDGVHVKTQPKPEFSGDWDNYETHGIKIDPMESSDGRRMVKEFEDQGLSREKAIEATRNLAKTGTTLPLANPIEVGDKFYKLIPEGGSVGPNSAFWATEQELATLKGMNYDQIAGRLGVPLASQQGTTFQLMEITAFKPGTSFTSVIAPTTEIGVNGAIWSQNGGGLQTLLTDRSIFTTPKSTGINFP